MDVEAEILELKRRVDSLEGSFGFLTEQVKAVHKDLMAFKAEMSEFREETRSELQLVNKKVDGLREDLPGIVGEVVRSAINPNS